MKLLERFRRSDSGQAVVEVAVMTPFLFILLVAVVDIGRLNHYRTVVGNSARAAVQYGAYNSSTVIDILGMQAAGQNDAEDQAAAIPVPLAGLSVVASPPVCRCSNGVLGVCTPPSTCPTGYHLMTYAQVTSSYSFTTLFNYHVIPHTITISRMETMEVGS